MLLKTLILATNLLLSSNNIFVKGQDECVDVEGWTDSEGDGCAWYDGTVGTDDYFYDDGEFNQSNCKVHGNSHWNMNHTAVTACCVCGGGSTFSQCQDKKVRDTDGNEIDWVDPEGDSCAVYETIFTSGDDVYYDDGSTLCDYWGETPGIHGYTADEICCVCGGGARDGNVIASPAPSFIVTSPPTPAPVISTPSPVTPVTPAPVAPVTSAPVASAPTTPTPPTSPTPPTPPTPTPPTPTSADSSAFFGSVNFSLIIAAALFSLICF